MNSNASAILAGNNTASTFNSNYGNNFNSQQNMAYQSGNDALNAEGNLMSTTENSAGNQLSARGQTEANKLNATGQQASQAAGVLGSASNEGQNEYSRAYGNSAAIKGTIGSIFGGLSSISDERRKNYINVTDRFFNKKNISELKYKGAE